MTISLRKANIQRSQLNCYASIDGWLSWHMTSSDKLLAAIDNAKPPQGQLMSNV